MGVGKSHAARQRSSFDSIRLTAVILVVAVGSVAASVPATALAVSARPAAAHRIAEAAVARFGLGLFHSCAVVGATAVCWGTNTSGQIGDGTTTNRTTPVAVDATGVLNGVTVTQVAGGGNHTCALSSAGQVYCWGSNNSGQLGDGTTTNRLTPVAVDTSGVLHGVTVVAITAGQSHTCALSSTGAAYCWGDNGYGKLGIGGLSSQTSPAAVDTSGALQGGVTLTRISAEQNSTCAVSSAGAAYCWGRNDYGQVGDGTTTNRFTPVAVDTSGLPNGVTLTQVAVGATHACALSSAGAAYCWGRNALSPLGDGTTTDRVRPVAVDTSGVLNGVTLTQIGAGDIHTCALSSDGAVYCWGYNFFGQLGDATTTTRSSPVAVNTSGALNGVTVAQIGVGGYHTCAMSSGGAAYCWGASTGGQVGDGNTINRSTPVVVGSLPTTAPGQPTGVGATAGEHSASVSWTAPSFVGSGTLTGYTVTADPGGATCASTGATSCTVNGLTGGQPYTFTAVAHSTDGDSQPSAPSSAVTPYTLPSAPTGVTAVAGLGAAAVSWTAPSDMGTGVLTGYTVTSDPDGVTCGSTGVTRCTVAGLTNGRAYRFTVIAHTTVGDSPASGASVAVTPGWPDLPASPPSGDGSLVSSAGNTFGPSLRTTTLTGTGFAANTSVTVGIYSTPQVLASPVTDGAGTFHVQVTVPPGLSGGHTFVAIGLGANGVMRSLTLDIGVSGSDALALTGRTLPGFALSGLVLLVIGASTLMVVRRRRESKWEGAEAGP